MFTIEKHEFSAGLWTAGCRKGWASMVHIMMGRTIG